MSDARRICGSHTADACDPHMHTHTDTQTHTRSSAIRREMTLSHAHEEHHSNHD